MSVEEFLKEAQEVGMCGAMKKIVGRPRGEKLSIGQSTLGIN